MNAEDALLCPVCGSDYSHHRKVETFERSGVEDGETYIQFPGSETIVPSRFNPSRRRNAVRIHFEGECGHDFWMDIIQHKGMTFIDYGYSKDQF